ncbi:glycosyltransferase family 2 protein [Chloroflexota bacterium]
MTKNIEIKNNQEFLVSVVTPIYNAAAFVTRAVESALDQHETCEVILVEDGSSDNSLEVCKELTAKYDRVHLYRHANGENRGAGASRNLGMEKSSCDYIAFVDADNFYLPNRFFVAKKLFNSDPECEGVYEAIGNHVFDDVGLERWIKSKRPVDQLKTLSKPVEPSQLAEVLISGGFGSLTLDGLVLKRSVLEKSGFMSEKLRLHQDTDFIIRAAIVARLIPGRLDEPVALRGIHDHNRISAIRTQAKEYKNRMAFWTVLYRWSKENCKDDIQARILKSIIHYTRSHKCFRNFPLKYFPTRLVWMIRLLRLSGYPELMFDLAKNKMNL